MIAKYQWYLMIFMGSFLIGGALYGITHEVAWHVWLIKLVMGGFLVYVGTINHYQRKALS